MPIAKVVLFIRIVPLFAMCVVIFESNKQLTREILVEADIARLGDTYVRMPSFSLSEKELSYLFPAAVSRTL